MVVNLLNDCSWEIFGWIVRASKECDEAMTCLFKNVSKQFEKLKSQIGIENCKINLNRDIKDIKTNVVENFDCDLEFLKEDLIK